MHDGELDPAIVTMWRVVMRESSCRDPTVDEAERLPRENRRLTGHV